jgi:virginiamycin B lyase
MISRSLPAVAAVLAVAALDACGGGGGGSAVPVTPIATPTSGPTASPAPQIVQSFRITIPAKTTSSSVRSPRYVSPNTGSIRIAVQSVNGGSSTIAPTIAKLASGAAGCAADTSGNLVCTVAANAATGIDVFAISTYASADASGTALATTTVAETVTATAGAPVALSLGGVPAQIGFSPAFLPLVDDGQIHRYPVTLNAVDASGTTIVGADPYQTAVSLQILNDPTHALSLSTASITQPGTIVTVTFDGSKSLVQGVVQATATGVAPVTLTASPLRFSPASLTVYDDQTGGGATSITQAGFTGSFTAALANGADGSVAVTAGPLQSGSAVVTVVPSTTFDVTTLNVSNGTFTSSVPVTILPHPGLYAGYGTSHQLLQPMGFAQGPGGLLWTTDGRGALTSFDPSSSTYASYTVDTSLQGPTALAFDANGILWYADGAKIGSFDPVAHTKTTYTTGLASNARINAIVAGAPGTMWFYDEETNTPPQTIGRPSAFGTIATANGTIAEFPAPNGASPVVTAESMALGPDGALWFADGKNAAIGRVDTTGNYTSIPIADPSSPNLVPESVVAGPDGKIWFAASNPGLGSSLLGTVDPSTNAVAKYQQGAISGEFEALIVGSDHNLWFAQRPSGGIGYSSYAAIGVVNTTTHAIYEYQTLLPNFAVVTGLVDRGDRTLWMLESAFGQIGKVTFK